MRKISKCQHYYNSLNVLNIYKNIQIIDTISYISTTYEPVSFPNHTDEDKVINLCAIQGKNKNKKNPLKNKPLKNSFKNKVQILHKII